MVVVTHEMGFAREVADSLILMDEGSVVERGDAREVLTNPKEPRTQPSSIRSSNHEHLPFPSKTWSTALQLISPVA